MRKFKKNLKIDCRHNLVHILHSNSAKNVELAIKFPKNALRRNFHFITWFKLLGNKNFGNFQVTLRPLSLLNSEKRRNGDLANTFFDIFQKVLFHKVLLYIQLQIVH